MVFTVFEALLELMVLLLVVAVSAPVSIVFGRGAGDAISRDPTRKVAYEITRWPELDEFS